MADMVQRKPTEADSHPVDEYHGKYKDAADSKSEAEKFGTNENPSVNDAAPFKNLRSVGG